MNSLFKIEIPKRNTTCFLCKELLVPGMEYFSMLLESGDDQNIRQDFCVNCWKQSLKQGFYWKSRIEPKMEVKSSVKERIPKALALIKEYANSDQTNETELFVLALFLARARKIVLRKEFIEGEIPYQLYEIPEMDEFLTVKRMNLSQLQITQLQNSLAEKLK